MIKTFTNEKDYIKLQNNEGVIFHKVSGQNGADFKKNSEVGFKITVVDLLGRVLHKKTFKKFNDYIPPNNLQTNAVSMVLPVVNPEKGLTTIIRVVNLKRLECVVCEYEKVQKRTLA
jgi:hypothetical protein